MSRFIPTPKRKLVSQDVPQLFGAYLIERPTILKRLEREPKAYEPLGDSLMTALAVSPNLATRSRSVVRRCLTMLPH